MTIEAKLIAVIILLLALAGVGAAGFHYGDVYGTNAEKVKTQAADISRKDTTIKTLQGAAEANRKLAAKQAADAKQETENHEKELAAIRARAAADAARRVRIDPAKFCPGHATGEAEATPAGGDGQADAGTAFLPEPFVRDLRQLAADADEVTADLRTLKARVEKAGCFAGQ
jgi:hypothetical protein